MEIEALIQAIRESNNVLHIPIESWWEIEDKGELELLDEVDTCMIGMIRIYRAPTGEIIALEEPDDFRRTLRTLKDMKEARAFISDRLSTYDNMWDGCGCKVDYDAPWSLSQSTQSNDTN